MWYNLCSHNLYFYLNVYVHPNLTIMVKIRKNLRIMIYVSSWSNEKSFIFRVKQDSTQKGPTENIKWPYSIFHIKCLFLHYKYLHFVQSVPLCPLYVVFSTEGVLRERQDVYDMETFIVWNSSRRVSWVFCSFLFLRFSFSHKVSEMLCGLSGHGQYLTYV